MDSYNLYQTWNVQIYQIVELHQGKLITAGLEFIRKQEGAEDFKHTVLDYTTLM